MARNRQDDRFRVAVHRRLEPGETIVATARVWTARRTRLPALAARYRDDAVVTDRRLMMWECGWWTRRPRRRVLAERLGDITVANMTDRSRSLRSGPVTRMRVDRAGRPSLVLELSRTERDQRFANALLTAGARVPA
ncbi:MAG TPA: hypothetical protein VGO03_13985 [Acidimicrobiia bacterium]|jgi:hypothetical protein